MAFFLLMLMFSLAGIPPLAGFFAKYYVFIAAIKAGLYALGGDRRARRAWSALITICAIVKTMYFDEPEKSFQRMPGLLRLCARRGRAGQLLFFVYPAPLVNAATVAAKSLF